MPGFSWQCVLRQSHPRHTDRLAGWVGGLEMQLSGLFLCDQGVYLWQRGLLFCSSINPDCLKLVTAQRGFGFDPPAPSG